MIIDSRSNVVEVVGENFSRTSTINTDKIKKLQYMLTEGLYKDPISSVIVEQSNNSVDAILESGKNPIDNPVIVELSSLNSKFSIKISDKGTGMSKEFFENTFMSMLSSTKENNAEAIGYFGIGSKSFLSLKRAATFEIRQGGVKCKYLCYKGEEFIDYDLLLEEEAEDDGVIFEMGIQDYYEYAEFKKKAKQKLAYYDTVVLIIDGLIWENKIYRYDLFQYNETTPYSEMHLSLKDVVYTIDWDKLGISRINVPLCLRFSLTDGLSPTPNREELLYNRDSIEIIKKRIADVSSLLIEKYNESIKQPSSFYKLYQSINTNTKSIELVNNTIEISSLVKHCNTSINDVIIENTKLRSPAFYKGEIYKFINSFVLKAEYTRNGIWKTTRLHTNLVRYFSIDKIILVNNNLSGNIKEYIKEKVGKDKHFVTLSEDNLNWYRKNILGSINRKDWRAYIIEWQEIKKSIIEQEDDKLAFDRIYYASILFAKEVKVTGDGLEITPMSAMPSLNNLLKLPAEGRRF